MESSENRQRIPHRTQTMKFLPGKNNFYWNEERFMCYVILLSIVTGYCLFMVNDSEFIIEKWTFLIPVLISIIFLSTVVNQLLASFSNPGIVELEDYKNVQETSLASTFEGNEGTITDEQVLVPVMFKGDVVNLKFCKTCKIIRPPRASHCKYCDVCVYRADHHCPFLGNSIGLKNYKNFYYFLVSVVLLTTLGFTFPLLHLLDLSRELGSIQSAMQTSPISIIVMVACVLGGSFPVGLLCFHTYILMTGTTSREVINNTPNSYTRKNPFQNCFITLFRTGKPKNYFESIN